MRSEDSADSEKAGRWRIGGFTEVGELGAGAQGRVVLARHDEGGGPVAIKYLTRTEGDAGAVERLRDEAAMLARVSDPHVVRVYRFVTSDRGAALVMEAVDGVSLKRMLAENAPLGPEAALAVLKGSLLGLAAAHAVGVVHRDYKPANVVVRGDGLSKLIDFGIAALAGEGSRSGTPAYMAPEQWNGDPASPATDVYAATCVFFECVTGRRPYTAEAAAGLMNRHLNDPVPAGDVPEAVRGLVERGMAKDPAARPQGAAAFVAELESAATAAYGPDWERRGVGALAVAAVAFAALFPIAATLGAGGAAGLASAASAGAGGAAGAGAAAGAGGAGAAGAGAGAAGAGAAGGGVLAATGAKVAVAVGTATVVAAGGGTAAYVAAGDDDPPPVRPVAAVSTVRSSSPIPGRPTLQVQNAQIVRVSGLPDGPVLQRANAALRAPLDRQVAAFRRYIAGTHNGANVPRCATVGSKAAVHYSGPRLVSVFYSFQTRSCSVADETPGLMDTVTVDLRTGRALGPADILRDYSAAGIAAVARAMPPSTEENRYCLNGPLARAHFEPDPRGLPAVAPMQITFTPNSLRLNYVVPQVECWSGGTWNVPYARAGELIKPDVAALLPSAPSPERT
ncbi:serine/threonine-protein kinase [Actinomadura sp. 21ATH]|uniref:serine/threonine-protein kinase n=1 Tax=Actinomadura sp. 21ATH TaxID=1735444 RepID=UPI0035C08F4C